MILDNFRSFIATVLHTRKYPFFRPAFESCAEGFFFVMLNKSRHQINITVYKYQSNISWSQSDEVEQTFAP